ncbi:MAG TPA: DUF4388 domain-containing protein [Chloroflexia bacterium]|nr:DUF4388 domain-containing protein [Chloroflexia bacterium]
MALEGPLQEFSINDIISLVSLGKQSGAAEIEGPINGQPASGRLFFRGGNVCHAILLDLPPLEAALTFFVMEEGYFRFLQGVMPEREDLRISNEMLIMQGINRTDQWKEIKSLVQSNDVPVLVENPQGLGAGVNLKADDWRLLTLISGQDDVAMLARKTGLGDFRTKLTVANLLKSGLIEKKARNLKYVLYAELDQIAISQLGQPAKALLDQSYQRLGLMVEDDISFEQALDVVNNFRKLAALLVGPGRSEKLAEQMRERVRTIYQRQ